MDIVPQLRVEATFTVRIVCDQAAEHPIGTVTPAGVPTAVVSPKVRHDQLGAWIESVFLGYVRRSDRLIGHPGELEIVVRPGNPGTIDILDQASGISYHGVITSEAVE